MDIDSAGNADSQDRGSSTWPLYAIIAIAAVALLALQMRRPAQRGELIGRPLPALDAAGWINSDKPLAAADLRGKFVLIDFWATWCAPCHDALPELIQLKDRYRDQGLVVIGLTDEGNERGEVKSYVASVPGMDWPIGYEAVLAFDQLGIEMLPTFVLFDRTGRAVWGGHDLNAADEAIVAALAKKG